MRIFIDRRIYDDPAVVDKEVGEICSAAAERNTCRCASAGKDLALGIRRELVAATDVDESALVIENRNETHAVVEKLKNLLAGCVGTRPHEVGIHESRQR